MGGPYRTQSQSSRTRALAYLRELRMQAWHEAREICYNAANEHRAFFADEQARWNSLIRRLRACDNLIRTYTEVLGTRYPALAAWVILEDGGEILLACSGD